MASTLTWEWLTPSGEVVSAAMDLPSKVETVWLGPRLISRSPPGGQPGGHPVPLAGGEARVEFNAEMRECVLVLGGMMVPPSRVATKRPTSVLTMVLVVGAALVVGMVTLAGTAYYAVRKFQESSAAQLNAPLTESYRAESGLLVAHYPADFAAAPRGKSSLQLTRGGLRDDSILLVAVDTPVSEDPAELSRVALKPILDAFAVKGGTMHTLTAGPADCLGMKGYSTTGVTTIALETVSTWSCTFVHEGHGYIFFTNVNQLYALDQPLLTRIVNATELTAPETTPPPSHPAPRGAAKKTR